MKRVRRVWDDLASSPEEADDLAIRAELMITLSDLLEGIDPDEVAARYGVSPVTAADILEGRIDRLTRDILSAFSDTIARIHGQLNASDQ